MLGPVSDASGGRTLVGHYKVWDLDTGVAIAALEEFPRRALS